MFSPIAGLTGLSGMSGMVGQGPAGPPGVLILDTFTDADTTPLGSHTMDTGPGWSGGGGDFEIDGNQAKWVSGSAFIVTDAGQADVTITCDISGSLGQGVTLRWTDDDNCWFCRYAVGSGWVEIWKRESGFDSLMANEVLSDPGAHALTVVADGTSIQATVGAVTAGANGAFNQMATNHGLCSNLDDTDQWDNFQVTTP